MTPEDWLAGFLLAFCRLGAFIMVAPGFSSIRLPMAVRLHFAIAFAAAAVPLVPGIAGPPTPVMVAAEIAVGLMFGMIARIWLLALSFAAQAVATATGLGGMPGSPIDDQDPSTPLAALMTATAIALFFATGMHAAVLAGMAGSYAAMPPGAFPDDAALTLFAEMLATAHLAALRLAMPFLAFALLVNLAIGLANRMVPQLPIYFVSLPWVALGGLAWLTLHAGEAMANLVSAWRDALLAVF